VATCANKSTAEIAAKHVNLFNQTCIFLQLKQRLKQQQHLHLKMEALPLNQPFTTPATSHGNQPQNHQNHPAIKHFFFISTRHVSAGARWCGGQHRHLIARGFQVRFPTGAFLWGLACSPRVLRLPPTPQKHACVEEGKPQRNKPG